MARSALRVVICGDLNCSESTPALQQLLRGLRLRSAAPAEPSNFERDERIDHVLVADDTPCSVDVLYSDWSDHALLKYRAGPMAQG